MLNWETLEDYKYIEDLEPNQIAWEFLRRNNNYKQHWERYSGLPTDQKGYNTSKSYASEWQLEQMVDYNEVSPNLHWRISNQATVISRANRIYLSNEPSHVALGFNLNQSINKQLESAKNILEEKLNELKTNDLLEAQTPPNALKIKLTHLRVLDAKSDNATPTELAIKIYFEQNKEPHHDSEGYAQTANTLSKQLEVAEKLCNGDYEKLLTK